MALVLLLVFAAVMALLMWGSIWAMNAALTRMVGDKHRDLQQIVETGQVPARWRGPYEARMARLAGDPRHAARLAQMQRSAEQTYLKKLDRLAAYVRRATLVDGEDTRQALLDSLANARARWDATGAGGSGEL